MASPSGRRREGPRPSPVRRSAPRAVAGFRRVATMAAATAGIARPQRHRAAGAGDDIGERGAPGPRPDHRDALDGHGAAQASAAGSPTRLVHLVERPARPRAHVERDRAGRGRAVRRRPRRSSRALSVHSAGGGTTSGTWSCRATSSSASRIAWLAATPPAATSAVGAPKRSRNSRRPWRSRSVTISTTASWNEAAEVGDVLVRQRRDLLGLEPHRRLEPGQREIGVAPAAHRPRQEEAAAVAAGGLALDLRPAGIAEAEQLRGLVEGLADGVVARGAEPDIIADAAHRDDLGVAARGEEQAVGKRRAVGEPRGERMGFEMIDRDQRPFAAPARSPWRW